MRWTTCVSLFRVSAALNGAVSRNSRIVHSRKITHHTPTFWLWPTQMQWSGHCTHVFHISRRSVLPLHKTQSQILTRNLPAVWNLPAQAAARLPGRQRALLTAPRQISDSFFVLGNEFVIDGIVTFHWDPLHGCFLQNLSRPSIFVQASGDHGKQCLKKMVKKSLWGHFWLISDVVVT